MSKEKLKEYALWYYFKYFPSKRRLFDKVFSKSWKDESLSTSILWEIDHLIDEEKNIESRIHFCLDRNKNKRYIMTNLLTKGYDKYIVEKKLKQLLEEKWGSLLDTSYVQHKVLMYKEKGKSKGYVLSKMIESREDRSILEGIIDEVYSQWDEENLFKEYEKLKGKFETKKIIEKLLRKGFSYEDIKKCF